jgi:hypothetical protein
VQRRAADGGFDHLEPPSEHGPGGERGGRRGARDREAEQKLSVSEDVGTGALDDGFVARGFARNGVFALGQPRERVEEQHAPRCGRHEAQPQVAACEVGHLVLERHGQLGLRQSRRGIHRKEHSGTHQADNERARQPLDQAHVGNPAQAGGRGGIANHRIQLGIDDGTAGLPPGASTKRTRNRRGEKENDPSRPGDGEVVSEPVLARYRRRLHDGRAFALGCRLRSNDDRLCRRQQRERKRAEREQRK